MGMLTFPAPPEWLRSCVVCADLYAAYRDRAAAADRPGTLAAQDELCGHLVAEHLGRVPDYAPGCPTCAEWRAAAAEVGRAVRQVADADVRHRAAHLFAPTLGAEGPAV